MCDNETLALWAYNQAMEPVDTSAYQAWLAREVPGDRQASHGSSAVSNPLFSLIIIDSGNATALRETIRSVESRPMATELIITSRLIRDIYSDLKEYADGASRIVAIEGDDATAQATALKAAQGKFVGFISSGDQLPAGTLISLAHLISQSPKVDLLYTDEDWFDDNGRSRPRFKCAWDPEAHMGFDLFGRLCLMRLDLVRAVGGIRATTAPAHQYDLHLRVAAASKTSAIYHVPKVCYSRRIPSKIPPDGGKAALASYAVSARPIAAEAASASFGRQVSVGSADAASFINRVMWPLPDVVPLVSVIVPTRDRSDLLERCVNGVLDGTEYHNIELIIVDNGSAESETFDLFAKLRKKDPRVQVIRDVGSFNFSRLINLGVRHAQGNIIALLNNDVEIVSQGWLSDLVALAARYEIGCVGAKLLYGTNELQHAGIVLQAGPLAMHAFRLCGLNDLGYDGQPVSTRAYLAVTAACMLVKRHLFDAVGGFDERFEVAFNDVDFCLKIADQGYLNVCSPHEPLLHHEGMSRGPDTNAEHRRRFERELALLDRRWTDRLQDDPYGSPNICWNWSTGFQLSDRPQSYVLR